MVGIPTNAPQRAFFFNLHQSLGIATAIVVVALIVWRLRPAAPLLPAAMSRCEKLAADASHRLSCMVMVLMTITGYLTSSLSEYGPRLFGIPLPQWRWEGATLLIGVQFRRLRLSIAVTSRRCP